MAKENDKKIVINPVTRIEGHASITIQLDDQGQVQDAKFHVNEFRGFEKFCEGRMFTEMPVISPRICGICPISHTISSVKACEMIMKVDVPHTAVALRRLIQLGQLISSHALSFFHLSAPDMLLGWDSDPVNRNVLGIAAQNPDLALKGIRLRKFGQEISERITGKKIHIAGIVPGGMAFPLTADNRQALLDWLPEVTATTEAAIDIIKGYQKENKDFIDKFANFPSMYMGMIGPEGEHELYDGTFRVVDAEGNIVVDRAEAKDYAKYIAEEPVEWSYLKYPYYKPFGYPKGIYRVGPLARLNVVDKMKTPKAQKEFEEFKALGNGKPVHQSFYFHYARLIETLSAIEEVEMILNEPDILSEDIQSQAKRNQNEGIGCCEAPRGILFHHYKTDDNGILNNVNLLIATGQNNPSMNQSVLEVAKEFVKGDKVEEGALNRVEGAIRCYDPCLSCSTHALGSMPMKIKVLDHQGGVVNVIQRD